MKYIEGDSRIHYENLPKEYANDGHYPTGPTELYEQTYFITQTVF
jgi:hypothetical protein